MEVRRAEGRRAAGGSGGVRRAQEAEHPLQPVCASFGQHRAAGIVSLSRGNRWDLPDRTILITGGTGALGSAVVAPFLDAGWRVVVTWVDPTSSSG